MKRGNVIFIYSNGAIRQESHVELIPFYREFSTKRLPSFIQPDGEVPSSIMENGRIHDFTLQRLKTSSGKEYFIYAEY